MADLDALRRRMMDIKKAKSTSSYQNNSTAEPSCSNYNSSEAEYHYNLGQCYFDGLEGYQEDIKKAYDEFLKAAQLGHLYAMVMIGCDYSDLECSVLGYDIEEARKWGNKALEKGNVDGYDVLSGCTESGQEEVQMLELGISKGSQSCIETMAEYLISGYEHTDGYVLNPNKEKALNLLKSANWDKYHTYGLEMLGELYQEKGDIISAKNCFERILELTPHDYETMVSLGTLFRTEDKIKDFARAYKLFEEAARGGNLMAMNGFGVMLYLGEGIEQDEKGAIEWITKAAQGGLHQAMINLYDILIDEKRDEALYWLNRAEKEGSEDAKNRLQEMRKENSSSSIDTTRSDKIYDNFLNNLENTFNLSPSTILNSGFPNRVEGIQKVIDKGDLAAYEVDRLKILQAWLSLCYFRRHFLDDDFSEYEDDYFKILDSVDNYIKSMSEISDEGAYIYYIANMYSANRFRDVDPIDKLEELWIKLSEIELDETLTEFKVEFWKDMAQEVYDLMSEILDSDSDTFDSSDSYEKIKDRVISIVADKLCLDEDEVHTYSRLETDLGADSLDAVELIMEMEKEFQITIPDKAAEKIRTVGDIITYIKTHL